MREPLYMLGVIFIVVGVVLTFVTFGIGFICAWPLVVVGLIILLIGAVLPPDDRTGVTYHPHPSEAFRNKRYCTKCGREIPIDANVCPYCGKDFRSK
jgi:ribosomal protein L40E